MGATFQWCEDNGAATGSPAKGTSRTGFGADTNYPLNVNWKSVDDCSTSGGAGTAYTSAPITAPTSGTAYSYTKYQYGKFTGTFNQISAGYWANTGVNGAGSQALSTGLTLMGKVTSTYATPATTLNAALTTNMSTSIATGTIATNGQAVLFSTVGPEGASPTSTLTAAGYTQYLATQLGVASTATAGDTPTVTLTLQYNEN